MCFNVGGLGWVSTWGLGKHVPSMKNMVEEEVLCTPNVMSFTIA
jgi:hypothetical protein